MTQYISAEDRIRMREATDRAVAQGFENAHDAWRAMALECLQQICLTKAEFTVNDVRDLVQLSDLKTHDNRAMGGVMVTGKRNGWLMPTGRSIPSVVGHKVHIQIWKSLIYRGK